MDAQLESLLSQHGLQQAIEPLVKVGVDSHVALGYVDQEVIALMRRDHGLPFVTSKMLQDKMPVLLNFASNGTLRSVSRAQGRHISPILPNACSITEAGCAKPLDSQSALILARGANEQVTLISGAGAVVQSSGEQGVSIPAQGAELQASGGQGAMAATAGGNPKPCSPPKPRKRIDLVPGGQGAMAAMAGGNPKPCSPPKPRKRIDLVPGGQGFGPDGNLRRRVREESPHDADVEVDTDANADTDSKPRTRSPLGAGASKQSFGEQGVSIPAQGVALQSSGEQVALISEASAAVPSSGEQAASISEASAAVPSSGEQAASISEASAAVPSSGEQGAMILGASAAVPSSGEQAASISEASAVVPSSGEQVASISEASAAVQSSGGQGAMILGASAAVPSSGEQAASILEASAAVQSSGEQAASILEASAAVQSSREQAASILGPSASVKPSGGRDDLFLVEGEAMPPSGELRWATPLLGKRPSSVPSVYRKESKTANVASLYPDGRINNRFQCPMCLRWYLFNNPQTFNANKARHVKNCKGQNDIPAGLAEANRKAHKYKDAMAKRKAGKHTDAMASPMRVKRSAQVVQASKSSVLTGSEVARGPDKHNLMAAASSILEFSQKAHQSSVSDSSAAMDLPAHIEESVASFRTDFYTTEQENENCESIARKFGLDAQKIFILNHKRYRGFKTENTKLKAGTLLLLKGCHGNIEKTELDSKAKRRKR